MAARIIKFPNDPVSTDGFIESRNASNKKGRSVQLTFKLWPEEARFLEQLLYEYKQEGYETISDVLRHAVRDHIDRLLDFRDSRTRKNVANVAAQLEAIRQHMVTTAYASDWDSIVEGVESEIARSEKAGSRKETIRVLGNVQRRVSAINVEFWRTFYEQEIERRWGQYL